MPISSLADAAHATLPRAGELLAFAGTSGSGKTTAMRTLLATAAHDGYTHVSGAPVDWRRVAPASELVVVDELVVARDVVAAARLLAGGHAVIAACHLPRAALLALALAWRVVYCPLDARPARLAAELERRRVQYTERALAVFVARFGVSFTSLDLVLETTARPDLDRALGRFFATRQVSERACVRATTTTFVAASA